MSLRDLVERVEMENERWRTRAKMQAVWTAVAAAGLDVFDESDGEASGEEGDDA